MHTFLLHSLLAETAEKYPDRNAVRFQGKSITYSELERMSNQLAASLTERGVQTGDRVGIMLNKSIEAIISLFGILKAGAIYVPIDPQSPVLRMNSIISNCGIECLITSGQNLLKIVSDQEAKKYLKKTVVTDWHEQEGVDRHHRLDLISWAQVLQGKPEQDQRIKICDVHPAYILHTSGSTGIPKGVVISHLNGLSFVNMAVDLFQISMNDRMASHAPLHFDLSVFDIFCAVKCGATVILVPDYLATFPLKLAEYIEQERISIWNSVSSVLTMLAERGRLERFDFDSLRLVHFSGDTMPVKYLRMLKEHMKKAMFYNIYGQTEANSSLFYPVGTIPENAAWKIPIGKPFPNFEVFAIDEAGNVISRPGEEGELHVSSSTVALGYWQDDARTRERFVQDPRRPFNASVYRTGDLVRIDPDGNYVFAGRKDHMIKSRGYRIELDEIEMVINSHPSVKQAVVLAVPDALVGHRIIAIVALTATQILDANELMDFCSLRLPKYMLPESVRFCNSLPVTSTGKIDRKKLESVANPSC